LRRRRPGLFLSRLQPESWRTISAGAGTKGPRFFDWAALRLNNPYDPARWQRFLLLRRSHSKDQEITFYLAFAPAGATLEELARIAGRRWAIEESFAQSKGEVGLDQYEVRSWVGWHRHMSLAMTAQALLAITRARLFAKAAAGQERLAAFKKSRGLLPIDL
jgi:SRSO17 transposase